MRRIYDDNDVFSQRSRRLSLSLLYCWEFGQHRKLCQLFVLHLWLCYYSYLHKLKMNTAHCLEIKMHKK